MTSMTAIATLLLCAAACGDDAAVVRDAPIASGDAIDAADPDAAGCVPGAAPTTPPPSGPACTAGGIPGACLDVSACVDSRSPTSGQCAGPAAIQCCTPRYADTIACDPNARFDPNNCLVEEPGDPGCPAGMARIAAFCVDRHEASIEGASPHHPPPAGARALSVRGAIPQGHISQLAAGAACATAGKRLCTDDEWLRACRGAANRTYPYGDTRAPGVCNDARAQHPAVELYGTTASWIFSHLDSPCFGQLANGLAPTGDHAGCVSADGAFDMMGNLHEWTANPAGTFRGGFFVDTALNGDGCQYATTAHDTSYRDYSTGFRCCADAN